MNHAARLATAAWLMLAPVLALADPPLTPAHHARAAALQERGDLAAAEAIYRQAPPDDVDALVALGGLLQRAGRIAEAIAVYERVRVYDTRSAEPLRLLAHATARVDPAAADAQLRDYLRAPDLARDTDAGAQTAWVVVDALADRGDFAAASALLETAEHVLAVGDDPAWIARRERFEVAEEARRLARIAGERLDAGQRARLEYARARAAAGAVDEAWREVDAVLRAAPRAAEAWAALADLHEARGEIAEADVALQRAEALAPFEPRHPARLGEFLASHYGRGQDRAAAEAYARSLRLDPTWAEGWRARGLLELASGDAAAGERSLSRYLTLVPEGPGADEARRWVDGVARERPEPPPLPEAASCPPEVGEAACDALWRAVAWQRRGRLDEALAALAPVRRDAPRYTRALNLEASLRLQEGDLDAAIRLYRESLAIEPAQELPVVVLWELLRGQARDEEARALLRASEATDIAAVQCLLAREAWEGWRVFEARRRVAVCLARGDLGRYAERAHALRDEVEGWWQRLAALIALLGVGGAVTVSLGWIWRRSGSGLAELLAAAPEAYPEVARRLAGVRHEVLKHHTSVLPAVADALERGDPEPGWWAAEGLYGADGAIARFREVVRALDGIARRHGVRLNLRRRDPTFAALIGAFDRLEALEPELVRGEGSTLPERLRAISEALNDVGYRGLGALLARVCVLEVDAECVHAAWRRACADRLDRALPPLEVALPEAPVRLRIFRRDLEDVLANLLRNAAEAGASKIAVRVEVEQDWVTGLERAAIRVCDDVPGRLTTALIRGRYIERGLGLTVDAISRAGGAVHVEDELGWSKAVVVRLPIAEIGTVMGEDALGRS